MRPVGVDFAGKVGSEPNEMPERKKEIILEIRGGTEVASVPGFLRKTANAASVPLSIQLTSGCRCCEAVDRSLRSL